MTASDDVVPVLKVSHGKDTSVRAHAEHSTAQAFLSQPGSNGQTFQQRKTFVTWVCMLSSPNPNIVYRGNNERIEARDTGLPYKWML